MNFRPKPQTPNPETRTPSPLNPHSFDLAGTFVIGRKDRLTKCLSRFRRNVGREMCNFYPKTFLLPAEYKAWKQVIPPRTVMRWKISEPDKSSTKQMFKQQQPSRCVQMRFHAMPVQSTHFGSGLSRTQTRRFGLVDQ
jgi:hypothetical protein